MSDWLSELRAALDRCDRPIEIFFRNDDAGWSDAALRSLFEIFRAESVPLDLAVIPQALSATMAGELRSYARDRPDLLGLHQHGFSHANHEANGRKCEFGDSRTRRAQWLDIKYGREILHERLGRCIDSIFTPPWNRCAPITVECLVDLGYRALSRDAGATPLPAGKIREIPVNVDWCRKRNGVRISRAELSQAIVEAAVNAPYVGVMLHHAILDSGDHEALRGLLRLLADHSGARCRLMYEFAAGVRFNAPVAARVG